MDTLAGMTTLCGRCFNLAATEADEGAISWERREKQAFPASQPDSTTAIETWLYTEGKPASCIA